MQHEVLRILKFGGIFYLSKTHYLRSQYVYLSNPVEMRSEVKVSGCLITTTAGSKPAGHGCSSVGLVMFSVGSGLCIELITPSGESYWLCVSNCV